MNYKQVNKLKRSKLEMANKREELMQKYLQASAELGDIAFQFRRLKAQELQAEVKQEEMAKALQAFDSQPKMAVSSEVPPEPQEVTSVAS